MSSPSPSAPVMDPPVDEVEAFIEKRIHQTRWQVKAVDVCTALLTLAAGTLLYVLVVALLDHWVFSTGLGFWGRFAALAILVAAAGAYCWYRLWPLLTRRVNPIYAAHSIEQSRPSLKNSVINFLLLRDRRRELPPAIFHAIEHRAADDLSQVPSDDAVDRGPMIRVGYVLLAVVTIFCLYKLFSPKDPLASMARMLAPWSNVAAPTRVRIGELQPGSVQAFHNDFVTVSAYVRGLRKNEPVTLYYSTSDGQSTDQPVRMTLPANSYRHQAVMPPDGSGLQQSIDYWIVAGDARTPRFHVKVVTAPAILVDSVEYDYPDYTGLETRVVERQGDLRAIEGTRIKLLARSNRPMSSAHVDFECDGRQDLPLTIDGDHARGAFDLKLLTDGKPEHVSYQLRFVPKEGNENPQPIRYRIEVFADEPPQVEFLEPVKDDMELAVNGVQNLSLRAMDPDFALRDVTLHATRSGEELLREPLLDGRTVGVFQGGLVLDAAKYKLREGDVIEFWAEARDVKQPVANRGETSRYRMRIVSAITPKEREKQLAEAEQQRKEAEEREAKREPIAQEPDGQDPQSTDGPRQEEKVAQSEQPDMPPEGAAQEDQQQTADKKPSDVTQGQQQSSPEDQSGSEQAQSDQGQGDPSQGEQQQSEKGRQGSTQQSSDQQPNQEPQASKKKGDRVDPDSQSGDAFERILKHREEQQKRQKQSQDGGSEEQGAGEEQGEQNDARQRPQETQSRKDQKKKQPNGSEGEQDGGNPAGGGDDQQQAQPGEQGGDGAEGTENTPGSKKSEPGSAEQSTQEGGDGNDDPMGEGDGEESDSQKKGSKKGSKQDQGDTDGEQADGEQGGEEEQQGGEEGADSDEPTGQAEGDGSKKGSKDSSGATERGGQPNEQAEERSGEGAQTQASPMPGQPSDQPTDDSEETQGGDAENAKGEPGAGQSHGDQPGSPSPVNDSRPRDKGDSQQPAGEGSTGEQPNSASTSKHESDSEGGESGDRSGGGEEGGGQQSQEQGTGGPGQSTGSDEGAGAEDSQGEGDAGTRGGNQTQGQPSSGQGEAQQGEGQPSGQGTPAEGEGDSPSNPNGGQGEGDSEAAGSGSPQSGSTTGNSTGPGSRPTGGGASSGTTGETNDSASANDEAAAADEVNLEYAAQATDLALQYLRDQLDRDKPDQELLDDLNWTREDMEKFLNRWEKLKRQAKQSGPDGTEAQRQLDEALMTLGLTPHGTHLDGADARPDQDPVQLHQTRRSTPPNEYLEQFRAYSRGTAKRPKQPQN